MRYAVVFERASDGGWGAYAPDLPGLGAVGATLDETRQLISEGIAAHIDVLREARQPVPEATTRVEEIEAPAA